MLVRVIVSLVCAVFGGLTISVGICNWQPRPSWAGGVCRSHVELIWLVSVPLLFSLVYLAMANRTRAFRRPIAAVLLSVYGIYGVAHALQTREWWVWVLSLCALSAAIGVFIRKRWAYALVLGISACICGAVGLWSLSRSKCRIFSAIPLGRENPIPASGYGVLAHGQLLLLRGEPARSARAQIRVIQGYSPLSARAGRRPTAWTAAFPAIPAGRGGFRR